MKPISLLCLLFISLTIACGDDSTAQSPPPGATVIVEQLPNPTAIPTATATPQPTATPTPAPTATPVPRITRPPGEIERGNTQRQELSLTFDCGASGVPTPAILDALKRAGVRTTFFLTGQWVTTYPELARRIAAEHEIANHSFSHPDFANLSDGQIVAEMGRAEEAISRITGVSTPPLWRAPFGSRNARIMTAIRNAGWPYHIYWTADSGDWLEITPAEVRARVNRAASNGAIIIQHCGSTQSAAITGDIISDLTGRGFRLVTVTELLRE